MITDMQVFFWRSFGFPLMVLQIMLTGGVPILVVGMRITENPTNIPTISVGMLPI
jgi:hypothetical protein